jgi:hypothetical protein
MEKQAVTQNYAVNMHARILRARVAEVHFNKTLLSHPGVRVFNIDLVNSKHTTGLADAEAFDVRKVKKWVRKQLPRINFLGSVDAALYYAGDLHGTKAPCVSWHAHVMAWGCSADLLERLQSTTNARFSAGWDAAQVFHFDEWDVREAAGRLMYALKCPLKEYSLAQKDFADRTTGEVTTSFQQEKRPLRPHNRVAILKAMGNRTIHALACGGGEGKNLNRLIEIQSWFQASGLAAQVRQEKLKALGFHDLPSAASAY